MSKGNKGADNAGKTVLANADAGEKTVVAKDLGDSGKTVVAKDLGNAGKTVVAVIGGKTSDRTLRQDPEVSRTVMADASKTLAAQVAKTTRQDSAEAAEIKKIENLSKEYEPQYTLNKVVYKTVKVLSTTSGEARILLVENKGSQYVLKLYYYGQHPNHDILEKIHKVAGSGLLVDVIDHGVWTNPNRKDETLDYELMRYCAGGSLDKINIRGKEDRFREIAIQAASAIDFLNKHDILHRDIKPGNFFFTDEAQTHLVLGDFGIAVECPQNGSCCVDTARTPIYAAPECYFTPGAKREIDIKSDYYSLGITLLSIWMGEANLAGNESVLGKNKLNESLPYPSDMSKHTLSLIKALTRSAPAKRCSFDDIVRWAGGENIFDDGDAAVLKQFTVVFNAGKKQIAHSPEELAAFMLADPELAEKYLYTGKLTKWLNDVNRPELAVNVENITETIYPKDHMAGLYATCYMLDPCMPYTDVKGKKLTTPEQIAASLLENFSHYSKVLSNPNDVLYIFLSVSGLKKIADTFPAQIKANPRRALWQLIYTLNPALPYYIDTEEGKSIPCQTGDDILRTVYGNNLTDDCWNDLRTEMFLSWLAQRDPAAAGKIRVNLKKYNAGDMATTWCVLYNLNPKVSYLLQLDEKADDYYFTHTQVAEFINLCLINYLVLDVEPHSILGNIQNIDNTRLYHYFKSKGVYDSKISWIKYCMDLKSKDNTSKSGPYDWIVGAFKVIKGLGYNPYYYFKDSKKLVFSIQELNNVPDKEVKQALAKGYLEEWMTVFFQENPSADLSPKFAYEKLTVQYLECIESFNKKNVNVVNFRKATGIVEDNCRKVRSTYAWFCVMRVMLGILCFVPIFAFMVSLCVFGLPFTENPMPSGSVTVILVMTIIFGLILWVTDDFENLLGSAILGLIVSLVVYYAIYFALKLIMPFAHWICAGLLLLLAIYLIRSCYLRLPTDRKNNKILFKPTFEEAYLEPLHFTYRAAVNSYFDSSIGDASHNYVSYLRGNMKSFAIRAIPSILLVCGLAYLFVRYTPALWGEDLPVKTDTVLVGTWNGTFEGREASLEITNNENGVLQANITVQYSNRITEQLEGTVDMGNMLIHFDDVVANGNLDGRYDAILSDDMNSFEGMYENYTTHKQVKFSFSK